MNFRDKVYAPTLVLFLVCAVIAVSMAAVYNVTKPVIEHMEAEAANEARRSVLPQGDSFQLLELEGLPQEAQEVYRAENGAGYVVTAQSKGYGGAVSFMIGFTPEGAVTGINMFSHNETPGLGTKVDNPSYLQRYYGDADVSSVDAISGATRTSNALKNALLAAKEAVALVEEG